MDFDKIENLVLLSKQDNSKAKEELCAQFTPLIIKLSMKTYVNGFDFEDLKSECYKTLFKCVLLYDPSKHRFVAYATNAIKNSINNLIRTSLRKSLGEGCKTLSLKDNSEYVLSYDMDSVEDRLFKNLFHKELKNEIAKLSFDEKLLIEFLYYKKTSLKAFAAYRGMPYGKAFNIKKKMLKKLRKIIDEENYHMYLS